MKYSATRLFISLFLLLSNMANLHAAEADGGARIRLLGEVAPGITQRVSVKQIESIGSHDMEVYNPYDKRTDRYTGVWFDQFVAHFAKPGITRVTMKAIDDYETEFTPSDWTNLRILIATRVNGKYIGFDQKGPMRIVFPDYDSGKKIYQMNLPKWMWMITRIEFE